MKALVAVMLLSATANAYVYEQCSSKTEFCPEDGSYQGCRVVVDGVEDFFVPGQLSPYDCQNYCEYLANDNTPLP